VENMIRCGRWTTQCPNVSNSGQATRSAGQDVPRL
jgi:hypothetical protein